MALSRPIEDPERSSGSRYFYILNTMNEIPHLAIARDGISHMDVVNIGNAGCIFSLRNYFSNFWRC
jgi:hypothetical protein